MDKNRRLQIELDMRLRRVADVARMLPALTARNGLGERNRLVRELQLGHVLHPKWEQQRSRVPRSVWTAIQEARAIAPEVAGGELYLERFDELELELTMMEVLGQPRQVRPMAARRFGDGRLEAPVGSSVRSVREIATTILSGVEPHHEPRTLPAEATDEPSLAGIVAAVAGAAGLEVDIQVEPALIANAAAGERTVYLAARRFGVREARRLAVHEVLGHLVAAANGRAQRLGILSVGTAGAFADQEGLAIYLEERSGLLDAGRLRTLAARVIATDRMHSGASFDDTVIELHREFEFSAVDAITLAERAYRGGGVARDAAYLYGWLRVRRAIEREHVGLNELRNGRVGLSAIPTLRELAEQHQVRPALHTNPIYSGHWPQPSGSVRSGSVRTRHS